MTNFELKACNVYFFPQCIFLGDHPLFIIHSCVQKGVGTERKDWYFLICTEELVWGLFCTVTIVFLSKRQVVQPVRSLSRWEICCWRSGSWGSWAYSPGDSFIDNCFWVRWELVTGLGDFMYELLLVTLEGKWGSRGPLDQRRGTLPWVWHVRGEWETVG